MARALVFQGRVHYSCFLVNGPDQTPTSSLLSSVEATGRERKKKVLLWSLLSIEELVS